MAGHVGGLPIEEALVGLVSAGAALLAAARASVARLRDRGRPD